jgi:parvulin-like peptidyl-prolyl isomerase
VEPGNYRLEVETALRALAPGTFSPTPVESAGLAYILYAVEKAPDTTLTYEAAQPRIEKQLRQAEIKTAYLAWIERLKAVSTVRMVKDDLP